MMCIKELILLCLMLWNATADLQTQVVKSKPTDVSRSSSSSVLFPVTGNVYPEGYYYVTMHIGQPPKPYFLDIDTGSVLSWIQCNAPCRKCTPTPHPLYKPHQRNFVPCKDPLCASLHEPDHLCQKTDEQCDYQIEYADHGSSLGVLVKDSFHLKLTNGNRIAPTLAFGCGYDQEFENPNQVPYTDGVLGLAGGKPSILAQLHSSGVTRNVLGHCFSGKGGGFLFFGDAFIPRSGIVWTTIVSQLNYYFLGPADVQFGGQATTIKRIPIIFDSGSTYTYFSSQAYNALVSLIKKNLNGKGLKDAVEDESLPLCWKGEKPFTSIDDVVGYFKPLELSFGNAGNARFPIQPEAYLIVTEHGNVCLGILNGTEVGLDQNLIGDISLQDKLVIYDNERQRIGWAQTICKKDSQIMPATVSAPVRFLLS